MILHTHGKDVCSSVYALRFKGFVTPSFTDGIMSVPQPNSIKPQPVTVGVVS